MTGDDNFISRWSKRKIAVREGRPVEPSPPTPEAGRVAPTAGGVTEPSGNQSAPLPPVESLTPESDFTPFMKPEVDPGLRKDALKTLFRDPRFNVMDGLDVYIDDYSKPDPLPDGWLEKLNQLKRLGHFLEAPEGEAAALQETIEDRSVAPEEPTSSGAKPDDAKPDSE